ncbi:transporter substrate-binding domain-containing protein [Vibrio cholerae]|nr:transporter substrate-binding domain-containing protein [Vibrio cholerae]EKF9075668.1 transporter substrate-binding domain-containing protein [Vibrio cholerae]
MRHGLSKWLWIPLLSLSAAFSVKADTLILTSLDWPPYSGEGLAEKGASIAVVKAAVEAMGHELVVEFYPWSRAVHLAKGEAKYSGYFPEYFFEDNSLLFSDSIGKGPLGFAENVANPIQWSVLEDLKPHTIGVVRDYINTPELDSMIAQGKLLSSAVNSDVQNLQKVAKGRVPLAVIDSNVFNYLKNNDPSLAADKDQLQMNKQLLVEKDLHIAFRNDAQGQKWQAIVNEGLKKIEIEKIMNSYLSK